MKALSSSSSSRVGSGCLFVFGLVFLVAGLGGFILALGPPVLKSIRAQYWQERSALIISSEVKVDRGGDSDSYSPEIEFEYEFGDRKWRSKSWSTGWSSSSSRPRAEAVCNRFPEGSNHPCFVNSSNAEQAVLDRSFQLSNLFGCFLLIFASVGGGIIWAALGKFKLANKTQSLSASQNRSISPAVRRSQRNGSSAEGAGHSRGDESIGRDSNELTDGGYGQAVEGEVDGLDDGDDVDLDDEVDLDDSGTPWSGLFGPQRLKPNENRWISFIVLFLLGIFWNGLSWFAFLSTLRDRQWFAIAFLLLFIAIGMVILISALYKFLQIFNPVVSVALSNGAVAPGETVDIAWEMVGRTSRVRELKISIIGEEVVVYVRGTTTSTDRQTFQRISVATATSDEEKRFGSATVTIPKDCIHSFSAPNNKIQWSIEVHGDIAWWPDIHETMPFAVRPTTVPEPQT